MVDDYEEMRRETTTMRKGKKFLVSMVALMTLAGGLAACGDNGPSTSDTTTSAAVTTTVAANNAATTTSNISSSAVVPNLSSASEVSTIPDSMKAAVQPYTTSVPNGTFKAYKVGEQTDKAQSELNDAFNKGGWQSNSAMTGQTNAALQQQGIFYLLFQKGTSVASVIGYPGSLASSMGIGGVGSSDTFYIVVSANS